MPAEWKYEAKNTRVDIKYLRIIIRKILTVPQFQYDYPCFACQHPYVHGTIDHVSISQFLLVACSQMVPGTHERTYIYVIRFARTFFSIGLNKFS